MSNVVSCTKNYYPILIKQINEKKDASRPFAQDVNHLSLGASDTAS